jgi:hypothetical protein
MRSAALDVERDLATDRDPTNKRKPRAGREKSKIVVEGMYSRRANQVQISSVGCMASSEPPNPQFVENHDWGASANRVRRAGRRTMFLKERLVFQTPIYAVRCDKAMWLSGQLQPPNGASPGPR